MSARVWTVEELDQVHPLPDGWRWVEEDFAWTATWHGLTGVGVEASGHMAGMDGAPRDVVLAVILASKGLDSNEALADALDDATRAVRFENVYGDPTEVAGLDGEAAAFEHAAELIRRGTVKS